MCDNVGFDKYQLFVEHIFDVHEENPDKVLKDNECFRCLEQFKVMYKILIFLLPDFLRLENSSIFKTRININNKSKSVKELKTIRMI